MIHQIAAMAQGMQYKIDKNAHKKGWIRYTPKGERYWDYEMLDFLFEKLEEEVIELQDAVKKRQGGNSDPLFYEACDVANIAMMIADVCGAIGTPIEDETY